MIFSGRVPTCAAISFFRSPIVSSSLEIVEKCMLMKWENRGAAEWGDEEEKEEKEEEE